MGLIDYDNIEDWAPELDEALGAVVPESARAAIRKEAPRYVEDAQRLLLRLTDRDAVIDRTLAWIGAGTLLAYHGTRLTETELENVQRTGLVPLFAGARRDRLARALSRHPDWSAVRGRLDDELEKHGPGQAMGRREGQVHLTLSKAGLTNGFCHYLEGGSEFDQRVAFALLGKEGERLLQLDGNGVVLKVAVSGERAIKATHPHFSVEDVRGMGDVPNLANEFLCAWAFRFSNPTFQSLTLHTDCGLVFREVVPKEWIVDVEEWIDPQKA